MSKKVSSFVVRGKEINGYGKVTRLKATTRNVHPSLPQGNIKLEHDFSKTALVGPGFIPVVNDPKNLQLATQQMLGINPVANAVFLTKDESTGNYRTTVKVSTQNLTDGAYPQLSVTSDNQAAVKTGVDEGWVREGDPSGTKWRYFKGTQFLIDKWVQSKGYWYYLGADEYMVTGWLNLNGKRYYLKTEEEDTEGIDHYGYMMSHRWWMINDTWYYFHTDGSMLKDDWRMDAAREKWYYCSPSGEMAILQVILWKGKLYYVGKDGAMAVNRKDIVDPNSNITYWADGDGVLTEGEQKGVKELDASGYNLIANMERGPNSGIVTSNGNIKYIESTETDVGYGHDINEEPISPKPDKLSADEAFELLENDLQNRVDSIANMNVPFTQDQFNALVSLKYNIGYLSEISGLMNYLEGGTYERSKMKALIMNHYKAIVVHNKKKQKYYDGWAARTDRFLDVFFDGNYGYMPIDAVNGKVNQ